MELSSTAPACVNLSCKLDVETEDPVSVTREDLPTPSHFTDALLLTLGDLTNYRFGNTVKATMEDVYLPVMEAAGIDIHEHPQVVAGHWLVEKQPKNKPSLHRKIQLCYRYRKDAGLCIDAKKHRWGLTEEGCRKAIALRRKLLGDDNWFPAWNVTFKQFTRGGLRQKVQAVADLFGYTAPLDFEGFILRDGLSEIVGESNKQPSPVEVLQAMAPTMTFPAIPRLSFFKDTVIDLLGEKTDYQANIGVLTDDSFKDEVLRRLDIDPATDPRVLSGAWPLSGKPSLRRQVNLALTKQRAGNNYCGPQGTPKTILVDKNVFGLTLEGVAEAKSRRPEPVVEVVVVPVAPPSEVKPEPLPVEDPHANIVRDWMAEQIAKGLLDTMERVLSNKLAKSYNLGEISDLIHNYLAGILSSDNFRERLIRGDRPTHKTVANWALRRAYSKFRNAGKDAHERSLREANTSRERAQTLEGEMDRESIHEAVVEIATFSEHTPIHLVNGPEGQLGPMAGYHSGMPLFDVTDPINAEEALTAAMDKQRGLERLEEAVKAHKPGAPDRYWGIYEKVCEGLSCKEIAAEEGVSRNRAASLTASLRDSMSEIRADSERAAAILEYIQEEPSSTLQDLEDEFGYGIKVISRICERLCQSALLECQNFQPKKSRRSIPTFLITTKGGTLLHERTMATEWDLATHVII